MRGLMIAMAMALAAPLFAQSSAPIHSKGPPPPFGSATAEQYVLLADWGTAVERERPAGWALAEHRKLARSLAAVQPGRKGTIDAFVIVAALDSDPVFGREARETARVLARRYGAEARTVLLAGDDARGDSAPPMGSPAALATALARVAEVMQPGEDVLVLYLTAHGGPFGVVYNDGDAGYGAISPYRLWTMLRELGLERRMVMISACYSGVFVPLLATPDSVVVAAAAMDRTSFGCLADNDWTFFGDALINRALRKPLGVALAFEEARAMIGGWEATQRLTPSNPQIAVGANAAAWLGALDLRAPKAAGVPVGRPATDAFTR